MNFAKIRLGVIGFVAGLVITIIIGFALGGWKTSGMVKIMNEKAVAASYVNICIAQFMNDPAYKENLEVFKNDGGARVQFIEKGGWDKMPGQKEAVPGVAKECSWGVEDILRNMTS
jgi:hypothetical protein